MRFHWLLASILSISSPLTSINAFTFGPYLPSYLCGPAIAQPNGNIVGVPSAAFPNGAPKALAGVMTQFLEYTREGGEFQTNKQDPRLIVGAFHNANAAGLTNSFGGTFDIQPAANLTDPRIATQGAILIQAQLNVLQVGRIKALPAPTAAVPAPPPAAADAEPLVPALDANTAIVPQADITFTMTVNEVILLTLQARNNVPAKPSSTPLSLAQYAQSETKAVLDGALVYVQDANNNRVGKFTSGGAAMTIWDACGADGQGIVHNALLSADSNTYSAPQFFLPWTYALKNPNPSTVTFMGAAVSDNGFGYHQTKFTVTPQQVAIDIMALSTKDVLTCAQTATPCFAACVDCAQKGGSKPGKASTTAKPSCTPDLKIGNPAKGQQTIWTAQCKIAGVVTPVAPAGAVVVPPPKKQDAGGNDIPMTADELAMWDQVQFTIQAAVNASDSAAAGNTNNNNNNNGNCPTNPFQMNNGNTQSSSSLLTTLAVALGTLFATMRQ